MCKVHQEKKIGQFSFAFFFILCFCLKRGSVPVGRTGLVSEGGAEESACTPPRTPRPHCACAISLLSPPRVPFLIPPSWIPLLTMLGLFYRFLSKRNSLILLFVTHSVNIAVSGSNLHYARGPLTQSRQSARLSIHSSELAPLAPSPHPQASVDTFPLGSGGGGATHTPAGEGAGGAN